MKTPDIPSDLVIAEELRGLLEEAISNLRDSERRALALRMDGHRYRSIGVQLGITDTAARMRVYRARKKIGARKRIKEVMLG